jgi:tRNA (guanine9-N1)-methyltransferase
MSELLLPSFAESIPNVDDKSADGDCCKIVETMNEKTGLSANIELAPDIGFIVNRGPKLSKEEKKILKLEKKRARYQRVKEERKVKSKQYRERQKLKFLDMNEEEIKLHLQQKKRVKIDGNEKLKESLKTGLKLCVDLSFDEIHSERERRSLCKQLQVGYGHLRKSKALVHLHLTSLVDSSLLHVMMKQMGLNSWIVSKSKESVINTFPKESIVFLSPDAKEALTDIDESKVYIIGGIVDRTVKKSMTLTYAKVRSVFKYVLINS